SHAALAAVALGAAVLERHFTIDRDLPGVDQKLSIVPDELKRLIADVRAVEIALGSPDLGLREIEKAFLPIARRSLCAARDLPAGHRLAREDLDTRRPIGGIPPARWREVLKRPLPAPVAEGEMIPASLLAGPARTAPTRAKKSRGGAGGAAQKPPAGKARQGRTPSARRSGRGRR
ncbi:MAG: N-acetylneuraminate synthase family protein, partial [Planctomycetes bacterium]|nr:N-acetylneuraminate synthase family protein [Planctomycetota bacterium]